MTEEQITKVKEGLNKITVGGWAIAAIADELAIGSQSDLEESKLLNDAYASLYHVRAVLKSLNIEPF